MELLPGARFRIPVQNPAGAWGSGLVGRDPTASVSGFPDHPGGPQVFFSWALGFQPRNRRRPEDKYYKYPRGIFEKKISIFSKKDTWLLE